VVGGALIGGKRRIVRGGGNQETKEKQRLLYQVLFAAGETRLAYVGDTLCLQSGGLVFGAVMGRAMPGCFFKREQVGGG